MNTFFKNISLIMQAMVMVPDMQENIPECIFLEYVENP